MNITAQQMTADPEYLVTTEKTLAFRPDWKALDSFRFGMNASLDIGGSAVEGLQLRVSAIQDKPDRAVCFHMMYYLVARPCIPLARAEWRPLLPHTNPNCGPRHLRMLAPRVTAGRRTSRNALHDSSAASPVAVEPQGAD